LVPALCSTNSAADRSALFAGFKAPTAESDFPRSCIIGFGSSPSRCGPGRTIAAGQTWDLPTSDAFLLRVMCSSTPAGWRYLAYRPRSYCVRLIPRSPLLRATHFVAPSQTPRNCCVRFVAGVAVGSRNTCYRAARYGPTRTGLSPVGLHQLSLAPSECRVKASPMARQQEKSWRQSPRVQPNQPAFPRDGFNGVLRALPGDRTGDRAFLPPSSARSSSRQLGISVGMPGPHDFAVRNDISRPHKDCALTPSRPSHPAFHARDDREAPLL